MTRPEEMQRLTVTSDNVISWIAPKHWSDDMVLTELAVTIAEMINGDYTIAQLRMDYNAYMDHKKKVAK